MSPRFDTILITGAAGRLGTQLRRGLAPLARKLRLADVVEVKDPALNEEVLSFDLADEARYQGHYGRSPPKARWPVSR